MQQNYEKDFIPLNNAIALRDQNWPVGTLPLLATATLVYNHNLFLRECLEGILMQKTTFPVKICIFEDCSSDNSVSTLKEYENGYPNLFCIFYQPINTFNKPIRKESLKPYFEARMLAKYNALCEGDDFWTDPLKLQKQVDFLEKNSEHSFCFHSAIIKDQISNQMYPEIPAENREYSADELLLSKVAHTASFVFKNHCINFDELLNKSIFGADVVIAQMLADKGKVYGIADYMCVYRIHDMGVTNIQSSKTIEHQKKFIKQYIYLRNNIKTLSKSASAIKIADHSMTIALYYTKQKSSKAILYFAKAIYYRPDLIWKALLKPFK